MYVGRFAPSPTGPLHFGSLVAALASWLDARAAEGRWLVRIEDLDAPRALPGAADDILRTLDRLGLGWDGAGRCIRASAPRSYEAALRRLAEHTYWCGCTRREIADSSLGLAADGAQIYPGTCRAGLAPGKTPRALARAHRRRSDRFDDRVQGRSAQLLEREIGDFVLQRADGQFAYQLAVVVDDAEQGVTDVVRGADLLDSTPRQIYLQRLLGHADAALPACAGGGERAPARNFPSRPARAGGRGAQSEELRRALAFLGQPETDDLAQAVQNWQPALIPARRVLAAAP